MRQFRWMALVILLAVPAAAQVDPTAYPQKRLAQSWVQIPDDTWVTTACCGLEISRYGCIFLDATVNVRSTDPGWDQRHLVWSEIDGEWVEHAESATVKLEIVDAATATRLHDRRVQSNMVGPRSHGDKVGEVLDAKAAIDVHEPGIYEYCVRIRSWHGMAEPLDAYVEFEVEYWPVWAPGEYPVCANGGEPVVPKTEAPAAE